MNPKISACYKLDLKEIKISLHITLLEKAIASLCKR